MFKRGDFIQLNNQLGVVVGTDSDGVAPEDHVAVWFGNSNDSEDRQPEVWTIPTQYCIPATAPIFKH